MRGVVVERLPGWQLRVRLEDGRVLTCVPPRVCVSPHAMDAMLPKEGAAVHVEPSPYDADRGRVVLPGSP